MNNKYLHWVVICVIIGVTFFCAQFFGTQYQNTKHTPEEHILSSGEISQYQNTNSNIQSGASSTGIVKPIFHQPNTEWKTRTITLDDGRTLTYEFGKGNPREVMPKITDYTLPEQDYFHDAIVRPKTEKLLKEFLGSPMLVTVMNKCGMLLKPDPYGLSESEKHLPYSLYTTNFSMENLLLIDKNKRKILNGAILFDFLREVFGQIYYGVYQNQKSTPLIVKCLSPHEIEEFQLLLQKFNNMDNSYWNDSPENLEESRAFLKEKLY